MDPRGIHLFVAVPVEGHNLVVPSIKTLFALQLTSAIGFLILVLTALLSPHVRRYTTWFSFCLSWAFSCLSHCLLLFAGQGYNPAPDYGLCAVQAGLIYAAPSLTGLTTCAMSMEMLGNFEAVITKDLSAACPRFKRIALIVIPYVVWLIFFLVVLVISLQSTDRVTRPGNYCKSVSGIPSKVAALIVFLAMIRTIAIQVYIGRRLLIIRRSGDSGTGLTPYLVMGIRMLLFSSLAALAVILAVIFVLTRTRHLAYDLLLAILPVAGVCIFGTQRDLVHAWMFWKKRDHGSLGKFSG